MFIRQLTAVQVLIIPRCDDMKILRKTSSILKDNSGETIVEVIVAFVVLSIMLLIFSQGIQMATSTEVRADQARQGADDAMADIQNKIANDYAFTNAGTPIVVGSDDNAGTIVPYTYTTADGYTYVVYEAGA
jgi:type II secretory pathway pseudopilin PulG